MGKKEVKEDSISKTLNKADLVNAIAEDVGISKADATRSVDTFFCGLRALVATLNPGDRIQLVGNLTVECVTAKAREGHNPRNLKEKIQIPAKNKLKFTAGSSLVEQIKPYKEKKK